MITFDNIDNVIAYAKKQLEKTDYAVLPDVYLINKDEFISYRFFIRQAIINPSLTIQFPQEPKAIWK
jgi:hypothetical protein